MCVIMETTATGSAGFSSLFLSFFRRWSAYLNSPSESFLLPKSHRSSQKSSDKCKGVLTLQIKPHQPETLTLSDTSSKSWPQLHSQPGNKTQHQPFTSRSYIVLLLIDCIQQSNMHTVYSNLKLRFVMLFGSIYCHICRKHLNSPMANKI